jgi:anti-anti-sigma regulatory factor
MFLTEFNRSLRLVKITIAGDTTADEARSGLEKLRSLLAEVTPGFRLLADLSAVVSMPTSAAPYIGQIMESCGEKGVDMVVRLLPTDPSKDIGLAIMSRFHYAPDVPIVTCATMEEAMRHLLD